MSDEKTLENQFDELEEIITKMEDKEVSLEESFDLYEKGMKILKECNAKISKVEKKISKMNENGEIVKYDFE